MGAKDCGKKPGSGFDNYYKSLIIYMVVMLVVTILLNGLIVPGRNFIFGQGRTGKRAGV